MLFTAAMLLNEDPNKLMEQLGHSGTERVYQDKTQLRGYHIQEFVDLFLEYDKSLVRIERQPILGPNHQQAIDAFPDMEKRFWERLNGNEAYLLGSSGSGFHAVAWDGERVYDPKGYVYELPSDKFEPREGWLVYDVR
jgi:hypothetical protein